MAYATQVMRDAANEFARRVGAVCSGIVGNLAHNYGYHRAANEVGSGDYSRQLSGDVTGIDWSAADAIDMSMSRDKMILVTGRFYASWKSREDLRLNYFREIIGTLNGRDVIYMDTQSGEQGTSDSSHLWHLHSGGLRVHANNPWAWKAWVSVAVGESWADYCRNNPDDPITHGANPAPAPAPAPAPTPQPRPRPAPGPGYAFPLPAGYYFGPKEGPRESISCQYGERYSGRTAQSWLQEWANQLARRGWSVGQGRQWLSEYGNDGLYGSEYAALAKAFQADQHLTVDGEIGANTWWAAYHNPLT